MHAIQVGPAHSLLSCYLPVFAVATILGCQGLPQSCTSLILNLNNLATLISAL